MDADARIEALVAERERLEARVDQLERAMGMDFIAPLEWRLTTAETRVFGVLLARELATVEAVMAALYRDVAKDEAQPKIVDVFVCKIRRKLKPFGVEIRTLWARGYYLEAECKAAIRARLGEGVTA